MSGDVLLSLCMIVKDEEEMLLHCLKSAEGVVDEMIVIDTGSTDHTVEIAKSMGARVYPYRWDHDFSRARNVSLERARGKWILFLDADEEIHPDDRGAIRTLLAETEASGYLVTIESKLEHNVERDYALRLFRNHPEHYFVGSFHEQIGSSILTANPEAQFHRTGIRILHMGYTSERMKKKNKSARNLEMTLAELNKRPDDGFLQFCVAQAYLGQESPDSAGIREAIKHLRIAAELSDPNAMWGPRMYKLLAVALEASGQTSEALEVMMKGIILYKESAELYYLQAKIFEKVGKMDRAIGSYMQGLEVDQNNRLSGLGPEIESNELHLALGRIFEFKNNDAKAIEHYKKSIEFNAGRKEAYVRIGALLLKGGSVESVQQLFEQWVSPETIDGLQFLNHIFVQLNRLDAALYYVERILVMEPARDEALILAGSYLIALGKYNESIQRMAAVPEDSIYFRRSMVMRAAAYWFMGEETMVIKLLRTYGDAALYRELALCFMQEAALRLEEGFTKNNNRKLSELLLKLREVIAHG
ncbi:glycosyltransferase [Paenibacillus alkaliterrae]|uniref:tetratricopeptide repeat-containing glycosyltransferase family 2 protein n=1 Tax=Paenibacillus alkaliterrae TaxID=320909 RepID=UPI001F3A14AA|nr:TPR domain-containing glycosyltransferase [Paenibacillus alkaliterrae]MCF2940162.1 glycosyltransferase [Paenibacillus alkaliterrae]